MAPPGISIPPLRIYTDTSVIGGCFDEEFAEHSNRLMDQARAGFVRLLISDTVLDELAAAPPSVRQLLADVPDPCIEYVAITQQVRQLAHAYIQAGILGPRWGDDATHIAAATLAKADAIVSWNFKHIVRLDRIRLYNEVNVKHGYTPLTILSPMEVRYGDDD